MPRNPSPGKSAHGRQAIWDRIRRIAHDGGSTFTAPTIRGQLGGVTPLERIRDYLTGLLTAGYLERVAKGEYRLIKNTGVEAPRVRKDGSLVDSGRGQQAMWNVLRVHRAPLTIPALLAFFGGEDGFAVSPSTAKDYLDRLTRAGYLRRQDGWYQLIRNSGPRAPQILKTKDLYDPNTDTRYRSSEEIGHE